MPICAPADARRSGAMSDCDEVKNKFAYMLKHMISEHKRRFPQACRGKSDKELLDSLMNYFVSKGVVKKGVDGKFVVPDLEGSLDDLIHIR
jgi:hypothetical protein